MYRTTDCGMFQSGHLSLFLLALHKLPLPTLHTADDSITFTPSTAKHVLTSTESSLWVEDVPSKSHSLGHHLPIKSHFFGIVQGVAHQCGAEDVLHGLTQVRFVPHQGQGCVDVVRSNLKEEGEWTEERQDRDGSDGESKSVSSQNDD